MSQVSFLSRVCGLPLHKRSGTKKRPPKELQAIVGGLDKELSQTHEDRVEMDGVENIVKVGDGTHNQAAKTNASTTHSRQHKKKNNIGKVLKLLSKEIKREKQEEHLLRHRLFLFQKPLSEQLVESRDTDVQDNIMSAGTRNRDLYPALVEDIFEHSADDSQERSDTDESFEQAQDTEAVLQEMFTDLLTSMTARLTKRGTNEWKLMYAILSDFHQFVNLTYKTKVVDRTQITSQSMVSTTTDAAPSHIASLPKLPTSTTTVMSPYTATSEDIPTSIPYIATTMIRDVTVE